jgi:hypothetical protein
VTTPPPPPSAPGNPEPWSYPHETGLVMPTPDVLASPAEATADGGRRRRSPLILVAVATVVALLLGGGAYAGVRLWYGSGKQPEEATPSTVVAFARLDLSPGYGQKLKINNLLKKFPQESGKDAADELTQGIFDALDIDEASYHKNVEPWFAERVGVALWLDDNSQPYGLIVLAVDDESKARTGLTTLQREDGAEKFGFVLRDGYALVANGDRDAQDAADAASQDAERESLAASTPFRGDVDWLPARQTALGWADLGKAGELMSSVMESMGGTSDNSGESGMASMLGLPLTALLGPGAGGGTSFGHLKGRLVIGAQANDNGVEIRFRGFDTGTGLQAATADARSTVDSLPANSAIAGATRIGEVGDALNGLFPDVDTSLPEDVLKGLPPAEAEELRKQMEKSRKQVATVKDAVSAISGAKLSVAVSKMDDSIPALAATAEASSPAKAGTLAEAARLIGDDVTVSTSGNKVELKTKGYAADGGTLAGQALYREALNGAPEKATVVLYIDFQRLFADSGMSDKERREAKPFKAIGVATGTEDGDEVGFVRVVIK